MKVKNETPSPQAVAVWRKDIFRAAFARLGAVFLLSYVVLFLGMSRHPFIYDEGLVLTAAMRVGAGQVPHRDFYANYGPAQFYVLAGMFKVFGQSLLVERLFDLLIKALLVTTLYAAVAGCCRKAVAVCTSLAAILWLIGLNDLVGTPVIPVSLLNFIGLLLLVPVFERKLSGRRLAAAGVLAGLTLLFRYDTGLALFGIQVCVIAIALFVRGTLNKMGEFAVTCRPLLLGFAAVTVPPAVYFVSVSPVSSFVHDLIVYPGTYYVRGRNLPFPAIPLKDLENLGVYLPAILAVIALCFAFGAGLRARDNASKDRGNFGDQSWRGMIVAFALLSAVMFFKGSVRVTVSQMYLSIVPSLVLVAVLFEHRVCFVRPARALILCLTLLSAVAAAWSFLHQVKSLYLYRELVPWSPRLRLPKVAEWCKTPNPLTVGFCFLPEDDRIDTIEFIESHTRPGQLLYVGNAKHDRIFANDNIIYFATQRLPATHWSHFDPGLQNNDVIQREMIDELQVHAPPYLVLETEFEQVHEPNDSSRSSGVTLLDEFIRSAYRQVQTFGSFSVWRR